MIQSIKRILAITIIAILVAGSVNAAISTWWKTKDSIIPRTNDAVDIGSDTKNVRAGWFDDIIVTDSASVYGGLTLNDLTVSSGVYTDDSKKLTSTPPTGGILGYWDRTGTILSPSNAGDGVSLTGKLSITNTDEIGSVYNVKTISTRQHGSLWRAGLTLDWNDTAGGSLATRGLSFNITDHRIIQGSALGTGTDFIWGMQSGVTRDSPGKFQGSSVKISGADFYIHDRWTYNNIIQNIDVVSFTNKNRYRGDLVLDSTGKTLTYNHKIIAAEMSPEAPTITAGTFNATFTGLYIDMDGYATGTTTGYGIYIDKVTGYDTNYSIWDASGADWALDADNQKILFGEGQDASIYYDGTDFQFNSQEVGTGNYIFNNGDMGIHDTSPDSALEVVSSGDDYFMISSYKEGDGNIFIVDSAGNVGIWGAPTSKLSINAGATGSGALIYEDGQDISGGSAFDGSSSLLKLSQDGGSYWHLVFEDTTNGNVAAWVDASQTLNFDHYSDFETHESETQFGGFGAMGIINDNFTGGPVGIAHIANNLLGIGTIDFTNIATTISNTKLVVDVTGAVGINDISPDSALEVVSSGDDYFMISSHEGADGNIMLVDSVGNITFNSGDVWFNNILNNVGINTTSPDSALGVTSAGDDYFTISSFQTGYGNILIVDSVGNVGLGVTEINARLDVDGGIKPKKHTSDPCGIGYPEATIFYNDTSDYFCFCNGAGNDVSLHAPATACF